MTDDEALTAAVHLELGHARSAHSAARLLRDAATWRDLADYERTWQANAEVIAQAFAEIEPLMSRLQGLLDTEEPANT